MVREIDFDHGRPPCRGKSRFQNGFHVRLFLVVVLMLGVLRLLDRLPGRSFATYVTVGTSLLLCSIAALALGLLTSAAVGNTAQATLALPMLCFPAVLFSGAILPVHLMATAGRRSAP